MEEVGGECMNQLEKLNAMHKVIMLIIQGSAILYQGSLKEGWDEFDHIQHTSDNLPGQIRIFEKQLNIVLKDIEKEKKEVLKKSLKMYKEDRRILKQNIQFDQIDKSFYSIILNYITQLNELIQTLELLTKD